MSRSERFGIITEDRCAKQAKNTTHILQAYFYVLHVFPQVIDKVEALRNVLTKLSNIRVHVSADVKKLPSNAGDVWKATFSAETSAVTIPARYGNVYSNVNDYDI